MTDFGALVADMNGNSAAPQTQEDWIRKELLPTIGRYVNAQVRPLQRRIGALERKTENWKYVGVYEIGNAYRLGNFATHNGSLWHCQHDTTATPGTDATWQLCAKRGKDAR